MPIKSFSGQGEILQRRKPGTLAALGFFALSGGALFVLAAADYLYFNRAAPLHDHVRDLIIIGLFGVVAGLLYLHLSYRKILGALHRGILSAQEGTLEPVAVGRAIDGFLHRFTVDYDLLMVNLGSMFLEIEECQNRTIDERNRNDAILQSLPGALLCVDSDSKITLSNRRAEALFEISREELIDQSLFDILDLEEEGVGLLRDAFLYERQVINKEIVLHLSNASYYFTLNLALFKSLNPNEVGAAIVLQDITDYKRLQESTYNTEKLAAIGQLAAGVAHELNTPLGNIMGYILLLQEEQCDNPPLTDYMRIIAAEAKRCSRIVEDLLSYARQAHCQPESCNINQVIRDIMETLASCRGRRYNVAIDTQLAHAEPEVQGGTGQLEIILTNLLMNSIQATVGTNEPHIVIRTHVDPRDTVVATIEDNGPGVPDDLRHRIFDPFFTTKEVGEGTGLGLAISQAIVTKLGGTLKYDASSTGKACFVLKLPLA